MPIRDLLSGLFWLAVAVFICIESFEASVGRLRSPGPGLLPLGCGIVLGLFAIILVIRSLLTHKTEGKMEGLWKGKEWNKVLMVVTLLLIYGILLPYLGYLITTCGLMFFLFGRVGKTKLWIQAASAVATSLVTFFVFNVWLELRLPPGIFGY